uniref:Nucleoside phosphorylase domain-containing protein n=1 Tax=Panagrolaimus sp. ES5 TaxID=591445 RepID=A0AC34GQF3_9BILA
MTKQHEVQKVGSNDGGEVQVKNPHLNEQIDDVLYHFGLARSDTNFPEIFGDVKYVCTGGSPTRIKMYAELFTQDSGLPLSANLSRSDRFVIIMLNECIKLLHYAHASDVSFIRIGTSGGIDVLPGTVVVSTGTFNGLLEETHIQYINGKIVKREAKLNLELAQELYSCAKLNLELAQELYSCGISSNLPVAQGKTLCADDFYEGQMRLDGAFCEYDVNEKAGFIARLKDNGVRNIEMEATGFASFTNRANVKGAIICVALLNRLNGDQVTLDKATYIDYELRPFKLVSSFLRGKIAQMA